MHSSGRFPEGAHPICVRRCFYIDDVSGARYPGVSPNYLCEARPGDLITITGPGHRWGSLG